MIFRARHLRDDRLFHFYVAQRIGEPMESPAAEHLVDCAVCGARFVDLARFMDGLRSEADAKLNDVFSADRLRAQRQQIARRIENKVHPVRVISFPGRPPGRPAATPSSRVAPRWLGAAAAAGLLIGIGAGGFFYEGDPADDPVQVTEPNGVSGAKPSVVLTGASRHLSASTSQETPDLDDDFLLELEVALERPYTRALVAIDDLTPHVREIRVRLP